MTTQKMTAMEWKAEQWAQQKAGMQADALIRRLRLSQPIDPLQVALGEYPLLRSGGRDFGNRFDGKLRFVSAKRCFVLMYNTKYDEGFAPGSHHPRTRFSIAHELGHYFLEQHHSYLSHGGKSHASINEFRSKIRIEREADAFAATLLLPSHLVMPVVNGEELSVARLRIIADEFQASLVSTAIRSVQLSHFPCAIAGIRDGSVAWMFPSASLIEAGIYPTKGSLPHNAQNQWNKFQLGAGDISAGESRVGDWFRTYGGGLHSIFVTEEYIPVSSMGTLLVLLTMNEADVRSDEEDDADDADNYEE